MGILRRHPPGVVPSGYAMRVQMFRSPQPLPLIRGTHQGRRALHAQEAELPLEHIGHILTAMIVADSKATGTISLLAKAFQL
jgi:hypothetical protein